MGKKVSLGAVAADAIPEIVQSKALFFSMHHSVAVRAKYREIRFRIERPPFSGPDR